MTATIGDTHNRKLILTPITLALHGVAKITDLGERYPKSLYDSARPNAYPKGRAMQDAKYA